MRPRGEGGLTRRKDRRWQLSARLPSGRRVYAYLPATATRREAREQLVRFVGEQHERHGELTETSRLGPFLRRWLDDFAPSLRPSTLRHYEMIVRVHLVPALGGYRLREVTPAIVQGYLRDAAGRVSAQTVRHHRSVLRRALNVAQGWGLVSRNAAALAEPPRLAERETATLSLAEVQRLLDASTDDRLYGLWALAATTGMRQAELLGLTWRDIDFDAGTVHVARSLTRRGGSFELVEPKTARSRRVVPLTPPTGLALRAHRARQHQERLASGSGGAYDGLVFTTPRGLPLHGSDVLKAFHRALERMGLPAVTFHSLRHTYASVMLAQGVPPRLVMELLGHTTMAMTMETYGHVVTPILGEAREAMERAMGSG